MRPPIDVEADFMGVISQKAVSGALAPASSGELLRQEFLADHFSRSHSSAPSQLSCRRRETLRFPRVRRYDWNVSTFRQRASSRALCQKAVSGALAPASSGELLRQEFLADHFSR